ncbi:hypothetical protein RAD15_08830 [Bradyrhizobium sp. 14AA]
MIASNSKIRGSLGQVIDKEYLEPFLREEDKDLQNFFHCDPYTRVFAVEDPKFMYFMRNLLWSKFVKKVGFISIEFRSKCDVALSFAGERRELTKALAESLQEHELEVFYESGSRSARACASRRSADAPPPTPCTLSTFSWPCSISSGVRITMTLWLLTARAID